MLRPHILGVILNPSLTPIPHIQSVSKACWYYLKNCPECTHSLLQPWSILLLTELLKKPPAFSFCSYPCPLQSIPNTAINVILSSANQIMSLLQTLQWLLISE